VGINKVLPLRPFSLPLSADGVAGLGRVAVAQRQVGGGEREIGIERDRGRGRERERERENTPSAVGIPPSSRISYAVGPWAPPQKHVRAPHLLCLTYNARAYPHAFLLYWSLCEAPLLPLSYTQRQEQSVHTCLTDQSLSQRVRAVDSVKFQSRRNIPGSIRGSRFRA
jgi:hypothetical protein